MAQRQPTHGQPRPASPAHVGAVAQRAGRWVVVATLPLVVGTFAGLLTGAGTPLAGLELATAAMNASPTLATTLPALFQLGTLGLLAGCWAVGFGLLVDGLFD